MVYASEYHRFVWFCVEILLVCLVVWFRGSSVAEKSIVHEDSGFKGMSYSTPANPFKPENPFTPASDSPVSKLF